MTSIHTEPTRSALIGPCRRYYLATWLMILLIVCIGFQVSDKTQDVKNLAFQIVFLLSLLVISIWTVHSSGLARRKRWGLALAPWAMLLVWISQFEMVNNGDIGGRWLAMALGS